MTHQDTNAKEQWLICGLDVLEAQGHAAVKVEPMAAQLNVTKGSFYWHFENRQTFLDELCGYWLEKQKAIVQEFQEWRTFTPQEELRNLLQFILNKDTKHDLSMRLWAQDFAAALSAVKEVDNLRLNFCTRLFKRMGFNSLQAKVRARMVVYYQIGDYTRPHNDSKQERSRYLDELFNLLTASFENPV